MLGWGPVSTPTAGAREPQLAYTELELELELELAQIPQPALMIRCGQGQGEGARFYVDNIRLGFYDISLWYR